MRDSCQASFILLKVLLSGGQIINPILKANEVVKFEGGWILKLKLEKCFGGVNWDFLENVLILEGFDPK